MIYYPFWNASTCSTNVIIVTIISRTISMTNKIVFTFKINYVFNFKTWSKFLTFKFYLCVKIICSNVFNLLTQNHLFALGKEVISNSFFSSFVAEGCSKLTIGRLLSCVTVYVLLQIVYDLMESLFWIIIFLMKYLFEMLNFLFPKFRERTNQVSTIYWWLKLPLFQPVGKNEF